MSILDTLRQWDMTLFGAINHPYLSVFVDAFMDLASSRLPWVIIAIIFAALAIFKRDPRWLRCLFCLTLGVLLSDSLCYEWLKPLFARPRPCHDPEMVVRLLADSCGGLYGMPSNHAANGMAVAVIGYFFFGRRIGLGMMAAAIIVGLSRVYLGVHYPFDVFVGFLFGALCGVFALFVDRTLQRSGVYRKALKLSRQVKE